MIVSELVSKLGFQVDDKGAKQFDTRLDGLRDSLNDFQRHINKVGNETGALMKGVAAGVGFTLANMAYSAAAAVSAAILATGKAFVTAGDDFETANVRLRAATGSADAGTQAYNLLYQSARQTGIAVTESSRSFLTFYPAMQKAGLGIQDTVDLLDGLQKGMITAGQSSARTGAVLTQLGQAINANNFGGDELKSFLENAPPAIIDAFATAIGKTREDLKKLGSEGKLTNATVLPGLLAASRAARTMFGDTPATIGLAWGQATVAITNFLGKLNKALGINRALIKIIDAVGDAFEWLGRRVDDLQRLIDAMGGLRNIFQSIASLIIAYYMPALLLAIGPAAVALARGFLSTVFLLRNAFITLAAAVWANAAPLAAIVLWFGIIEDFITWIRGGRSLFGEKFGDFDKLTDKIKSGIDQLKAYIIAMANDVSATFAQMWQNFLSNIPPGIRRLMGLDTGSPVATMSDNLRGAIGGALAGAGWQFRDDGTAPAGQADAGPSAFGKFAEWLGGKFNALEQMLPVPNLTEIGRRNNTQAFNTNSQNNNITNNVTVNATGTDAASVAAGAQAGVRRATDDSVVRLGGSLALGLGVAMPRAEAAAQ